MSTSSTIRTPAARQLGDDIAVPVDGEPVAHRRGDGGPHPVHGRDRREGRGHGTGPSADGVARGLRPGDDPRLAVGVPGVGVPGVGIPGVGIPGVGTGCRPFRRPRRPGRPPQPVRRPSRPTRLPPAGVRRPAPPISSATGSGSPAAPSEVSATPAAAVSRAACSAAASIASSEPNSRASACAAVGPTCRIDSATSTRHSGRSLADSRLSRSLRPFADSAPALVRNRSTAQQVVLGQREHVALVAHARPRSSSAVAAS